MPLFLELHGETRGGKMLTVNPLSLPVGQCYPWAHGAAATVGVYSFRKSGASDIGSAVLMVFLLRITLQPSSEFAGKALPVAGSWDQEVVGGRCLPESIQRIF